MLFKKKLFKTVEDLYQDMFNKKNDYYNHKIDKYIISYNIIDEEHVEVESNIGRKRLVTNNEENIKKLNKIIVRSKVDIARRVDEYEKEVSVRLTILLISSIMIAVSFGCVISSFFIGQYMLFFVSLLLFGFIASINLVMGTTLYELNKEINSLKKSTHYHLNNKKEDKLIPQEDLSITQMLLK